MGRVARCVATSPATRDASPIWGVPKSFPASRGVSSAVRRLVTVVRGAVDYGSE
jgi:hypothetical protein